MGKRVTVESHHDQQQQQQQHHHHHHQHANTNHNVTPVTTGIRNIRKRKCNSNGNTNTNHEKPHKSLRLSSSPGHHNSNSNDWHDNDDEDSSSNDGAPLGQLVSARNVSSKQANNSSILLNNSFNLSHMSNEQNCWQTESPKPVYTLRPSVINGTVLYDLNEKPWRLGRPIGKGNFGEIFLASDNTNTPVANENAKFVVKIEPHSNGPLFVEIHCLMNTAKKEKCYVKTEKHTETNGGEKNTTVIACNAKVKTEPSGIPNYIASGSHYFENARYRFLVLPRFDRDLHSLIRKCRVHQKFVLTLAIYIIKVLEKLHDKGYCHNDVKAQNLMISKCKYLTQVKSSFSSAARKKESSTLQQHVNGKADGKRSISSTTKYYHYEEKQQTTDSGNSSEQEANEDDDGDHGNEFIVKRKMYNKNADNDYEESDEEESEYEDEEGEEEETEDDEDENEDDEEFVDDSASTKSFNSNSMDNYNTPVNKKRPKTKKSARNIVQYSGSNPVRSCRKTNGEKPNSIYNEMVKSHYLRPTKRVNYMKFFNEDNNSVASGKCGNTQDDDVNSIASGDKSEEFVPTVALHRSLKKSTEKKTCSTLALMESRRLTRRQEKLLSSVDKAKCEKNRIGNEYIGKSATKLEGAAVQQHQKKFIEVEEERIFLIDYGLASKYTDSGIHRPFVMDQRRAHDGTLEFTSRDAHMGAHSRRSDMECLGYNLLFWSQGYLPWKEAATNQQQEKVHRAKEYLMTDVRELLRQIYGKQVPKYLGEYMHLVGQLAYHDRPDYNHYRRIFENEYQQLGYSLGEMKLNMREIQRTCVQIKEEIENKNDFFDITKNNGVINAAYCVMQNMNVSVGTPFHERTLSNRVSPKNLRSKSGKKGSKKKKFSWAEILSQDPDQIARERAEKEFDREEELSDIQQPIVRRYEGKPTYAIIEILKRMGRSVHDYEEERDKEVKCEEKRRKLEKNYTGTDECDVGNIFEPTNVNDADESDASETDVTESSELRTRTKRSKSQRKAQKSKNSADAARAKSKVTASRRLDLKTPNKSSSKAGTPVGKRTRCQRASLVKIVTPQQNSNTSISTEVETKVDRSKSVKRRSVTGKSSRKNMIGGMTGTTSATALDQQEDHQQIYQQRIKREYRTRRRLIKTDQQQHPQASSAEDLVDDDSNSNFFPDDAAVWKGSNHNNEVAYNRNCRK